MTTRKGAAARARIIEAARTALAERGAEQLLGGVSLREVARLAELSPATVIYHFPTMRDLALAMVDDHYAGISMLPVEAVEDILDLARSEGLGVMVRTAAQANWDLLTSPEELRFSAGELRFVGSVFSVDGDELRARAAASLAEWMPRLTELYERIVAELGLRFVDEFTPEDMTRIGFGLLYGLTLQELIDPGSVRPGLQADALVTLVSAATVPLDTAVSVAEIEAGIDRRTRAGRPPEPGELAEATRLAASLGDLFADGPDGVPLTTVARALGIDVDEAVMRFGTSRRAAALSFARHLPALTAARDRRRDAGAAVSLADLLCELARCVQGDLHCARALLDERLDAERSRGEVVAPDDVRSQVPLTPLVVPPLQELTGLPDADAWDLASTVVSALVVHTLGRPRRPVARIAEVVLRLVPAGAPD